MSTRNLTVMFTDLTDFTQATSEMSRQQMEQYLSAHDRLVRPIIVSRKGKVVKTIGDSFLAFFESPTDAVLAGIQIQDAVEDYNRLVKPEEKMEIRVSINVGEVTEKDDDIYGDAVNIASRLLSVAEKNGVYFTEAVYLVMNKKEVPTAEVGSRQFKGVPEKIRVYRVLREMPHKTAAKEEEKPLPISIPIESKTEVLEKKKTPWIPVIAVALFVLAIAFSLVAVLLKLNQKPHQVAGSPSPAVSPQTPSPVPRATATTHVPAAAHRTPAPHPSVAPHPAASRSPQPSPRHVAAAPHPKVALHSPAPAHTPSPAVKPEKQTAVAPRMVHVTINSSPGGANVYVDGKQMGHTPIVIPVRPGSHELRLVKDGRSRDLIVPMKEGGSYTYALPRRE